MDASYLSWLAQVSNHYPSYNDALQRKRRERVFIVSKLVQLAAESVNRRADEVTAFEKLAEGGFNRTFLITMQDGLQLVARIPYYSTQPRQLLVASEAATLDFLRSNGIPVPKVYGYSSTTENPVGSEYMFLEFIRGINLGDVWYELPEKARIKVVKGLVELESKIFNLKFPASGSLYYSHDLEPSMEVNVATKLPSAGQYCIGPDTSLHLWYGKRLNLQCRRGPYFDAEAALTAGAEKELAYLHDFGRSLHPFNRVRREVYKYEKQHPQVHIASLQTYLQLARHLVPRDESLRQPTIRHPDLQPNNIFVSPSLDIISVIDWQHSVVLPLFLQCGIPNSLQNYGDPVSDSLTPPSLPADFESLEERQQFQEAALLRKRQLHFHYFKETATHNPVHQAALMSEMSLLRRKIFHHASDPWEGDNITLQADLVQLQQNWSRISESPCPLSFKPDQVEEILRLNAAQRDADEQLITCHDAIGVGTEGWVPSEQYDEAMQRAVKFKEDAFATEDDGDTGDDMLAEKHWIFDDFDEEEYE